nr:hypothetical protein [Tanacetum cinerariifolium]
MAQNIDFSGSDQIQTPQYPEVHPPSNEISDEVFQAKGDLMNSNQEKEGPPQDSDIRQLIREECCVEVSEEQKQNMEDTILELAEICRQKEFLCMHDNEVKNVVEQPAERRTRIEKSLQNFRLIHKSSIFLNNTSQISLIHAVAPILSTKDPEYSPSMGYEHSNTTPETESYEIIKSGVEEIVPILSENEVTSEDKKKCDLPVCENSPVCDDHSKIFSDSKDDDDISSDDDDFEDIEYVEASFYDPEIVSIDEENDVNQEEEEVDLEDISKDDDDISSDDDDFEDIEYVEASFYDPEIVSIEEENDVNQEEEEVDLEDISQIQDVDLHEKLLSITRLISNIESLNDNPTPDRELNSSISVPIFEESDNSLLDNFSPEFKTFCDHTEETRSGNTTTHADDSLPEYDSFCFEIEPDQERLINVVKNEISDDSTRDPLLEEADLFLAYDNSISPGIENFEEADLFLAYDNSISPGIENFGDNSKGDIHFLESLLIDDSILSHESSDSNFGDNPSVPRPPPEPPDAETDAGDEISVVMKDKDEIVDYSYFMFVIFAKVFSLLSAESEDTIFDPSISA